MPAHSKFRQSFIEIARNLGAAGYTTNKDFARHFGVDESTVARWRRDSPAFDSAIEGGALDYSLKCFGVIDRSIEQGDVASAWRFLERRNPAFKPAAKIEQTYEPGQLADILRLHQMSMSELAARGIIEDDGEDFGDPAPRPAAHRPGDPSAPRNGAAAHERNMRELAAAGIIADDGGDQE